MATTKTYKRNDTGPPITIACLDGNTPQNLTGATSAKFIMGTIDASGVSTQKVTGTMTFDADRTTGRVTYDWGVSDLNATGEYKAEVEITWSNGDKQTFPSEGYLSIIVVADVG